MLCRNVAMIGPRRCSVSLHFKPSACSVCVHNVVNLLVLSLCYVCMYVCNDCESPNDCEVRQDPASGQANI